MVTPDPLAARVHALIAQWRKVANDKGYQQQTRLMVTWCADDLEAALAAQPEKAE